MSTDNFFFTPQFKHIISLVSGIFPDAVFFDHSGSIRINDAKRIHAVIIGDSEWARIWAISTALVCHYPNYERDENLRTRISWIGITQDEIDDFVYDFKNLFDNCYWRTVNIDGENVNIKTFFPQYRETRKDFVDIEFEFIEGKFTNRLFQRKLESWTQDPEQVITLIFCDNDQQKNIDLATKTFERLSPDANRVQILAYSTEGTDYPGIQNFGDISFADEHFSKLLDMAKYLNYFYSASYKLQHLPLDMPRTDVEKEWENIKDPKILLSNIFNVTTMASKMRILGHKREDWNDYFALTPREIAELTPTEHNRWSVERLILGMRPCNDAELESIKKNINLKKEFKTKRKAHADLVAFDELQNDETGLNVIRYDSDLIASIPLIAKSFSDAFPSK